MPYTPILATLGYVLSPDRSRVLLVHRNARAHDAHFGKYNGLGGKLEADEDIVSGMRRELREEAGIECGELQLGGLRWSETAVPASNHDPRESVGPGPS
ncbi:MAG: NUDIX domain-containing protein [Xanthomonadales bacterium]|nr:NUDIX domain-containing protein [Xanthomonadales bacterium]